MESQGRSCLRSFQESHEHIKHAAIVIALVVQQSLQDNGYAPFLYDSQIGDVFADSGHGRRIP